MRAISLLLLAILLGSNIVRADQQQVSMPELPNAFQAHFEGTFDSVAADGTIYYNYINGVQRLDVILDNGHNITEIIDYTKVSYDPLYLFRYGPRRLIKFVLIFWILAPKEFHLWVVWRIVFRRGTAYSLHYQLICLRWLISGLRAYRQPSQNWCRIHNPLLGIFERTICFFRSAIVYRRQWRVAQIPSDWQHRSHEQRFCVEQRGGRWARSSLVYCPRGLQWRCYVQKVSNRYDRFNTQ